MEQNKCGQEGPQAPWQRGEQTGKRILLRKLFPSFIPKTELQEGQAACTITSTLQLVRSAHEIPHGDPVNEHYLLVCKGDVGDT